jgi:hypothetical protein
MQRPNGVSNTGKASTSQQRQGGILGGTGGNVMDANKIVVMLSLKSLIAYQQGGKILRMEEGKNLTPRVAQNEPYSEGKIECSIISFRTVHNVGRRLL